MIDFFPACTFVVCIHITHKWNLTFIRYISIKKYNSNTYITATCMWAYYSTSPSLVPNTNTVAPPAPGTICVPPPLTLSDQKTNVTPPTHTQTKDTT